MFIVIILSGILGLMCTDLFVPSLPSIAHAFHETQNHVQLTISLFLAGFTLSQLFYGPISDYLGRKLPLMTGVLLFIIGSTVCVFAASFDLLCVGRIIQGIGVGAGLSLARVILRDVYQGTQLAIKTARVGVFISLTPAIAPFIGGILQQRFGYHSCFTFMLCYGLLLLFLILFYFQETIQIKNKSFTVKHTITEYSNLLKNYFFMRYVFISGLAFAAIILYANVMPFIIQDELKLSAVKNGIIILLSAFGISFGSFISSLIVKKISSERLIYFGLQFFLVCGLLLCITD